jgi:hypothetical protein
MHSDQGRYWYSMSASLNRVAADRASQLEEALVMVEIDKALTVYINGLADRGHFDAVQVAPDGSSEVPDETGGVRAVVLGVAHPHSARDGSDALVEVKDILLQRGATPRVYRNTLVFLASDNRQLDNLKEAMRSSLAWDGVVRDADTGRLDLKTSDIALAKDKAKEARETVQTRLKETWCYLIYPYQDSAQSDVELTSARIPPQDGILGRASKKLVSDEALLPEIGPERLNRELEKYIWNGKPHLHLKDLWEYLNRYTYLPRLKSRETLTKSVQSAVSGMLPGPFAYSERWDEGSQSYAGLAIEKASNALVSIDSDSIIVKPDAAEASRPKPAAASEQSGLGSRAGAATGETDEGSATHTGEGGVHESAAAKPDAEIKPKRFVGTVMLSPDRPARDMHQIVEAIVEQLTTLPGAEVLLKLEIDAEVPSGLDRAKVRTLLENASTLAFTDKSVK